MYRNTLTGFDTSASSSTPSSVLIIPAYKKRQQRDYTYKTVQIVQGC